MLSDVQFTEAEATELRGKGIDILASQIIGARGVPKSVSNDPRDLEEALKPQREAEAKAKAEADAKAAEESKAKAEAEKAAERAAKRKESQKLQQRFDELTRARHDAERRAAERETALQAELSQLREQVAGGSRPALIEPKREDFDSQDLYVEALVTYRTEKTLRAKDEEGAAKARKAAEEKAAADRTEAEKKAKETGDATAQSAFKALVDEFETRKTEAKSRYADYDAVTGKDDLVLAPNLAMALLQSELGGDLAYHFGKNPEVVEELNELDQASMLKRLGQIELSLTAELEKAKAKPADDGAGDQPRGSDGKFVQKDEKPPSKDVSSAAEPLKPVSQSSGVTEKDPDKMTMTEYKAWRFSKKK